MTLAELGEISKSSRDDNRHRRQDVALGVGSVGVGTGLIGGGVPGVKATRLSADFMHSDRPVRTRAANVLRARRAGLFGYRTNAHSTLKDFELSDEGISRRHPGHGNANFLRRSVEQGKVAPEEKIIAHMKTGRKASYGLLAGGAGLTAYSIASRKREEAKRQRVRKADNRRRDETLVAGGGTVAGGSYGLARLTEHQGRKWVGRSAQNFGEAQRLVPELGGYKERGGKNKFLGRTKVRAVRAEKKVADIGDKALRGHSSQTIHAAGKLHGAALNQSYFGHVYGSMGAGMRKIAMPIGLGAAAVGGAGIARRKREERR